MKGLKFYDQGHIYTLDGEEIPSVSELSRFASREIYNNDISKFVLDKACERGTAVHKASEILDKTGKAEIAPQYIEYINAYIQYHNDYNIKDYLYIEEPFASREIGYAGTLDRVYIIDEDFAKTAKKQCKVDLTDKIGQMAIIDLKTSCAVKKPLAQIQLPAYARLLKENIKENQVGALFILHLKKDGKYKMMYFENDLTLFDSCVNLHKALAHKKRRKKNG